MSNQKVKLGKYLKNGQLSVLRVILMTAVSVVLTGLAVMLITLYFRGAPFLSGFAYESVYGVMVIYNFMSLFSLAIFAILSPSWVLFEDMRSNRWYYLMRMGFPSSKIVGYRLQTRYLRPLASYLAGAAVTMAVSVIFGLTFYINGLVALIGFGLLNFAIFLSVLCLFGVCYKSRVSAGISVAVFWLGLSALLVYFKFHVMTDRFETAMRYADQMRLSGFTYLAVGCVFVIVATVIFCFLARDKCAFYSSNPPKTALLEKMGIISSIKIKDGKNVVSEGVEFSSRKAQKKTDTMMLNLTSAKAESSRRPKKKSRALKIVLSSVAVFLLLVISFTSFMLKDLSTGPRGALGISVVTATKPFKYGNIGDAVIFVKATPKVGDYVLYNISGSHEITVVSSAEGGGFVLSNGKTVSAKQIAGVYYTNSRTVKAVAGILSGRVGLIVAVLSFLGAAAVLVMGIIIDPKKRQKVPAEVKGA